MSSQEYKGYKWQCLTTQSPTNNNTVSCIKNCCVDQVTVPHPLGEGQRVGQDRGRGCAKFPQRNIPIAESPPLWGKTFLPHALWPEQILQCLRHKQFSPKYQIAERRVRELLGVLEGGGSILEQPAPWLVGGGGGVERSRLSLEETWNMYFS